MQKELFPENVLVHLKKAQLSPFYLFYGENEYQKNKIIEKIKKSLIPDDLLELNFRIFHGDEMESDISPLLEFATSFPFMSEKKLVIVKRTDRINDSVLERLIDYLKRPADFTCIIFIIKKANFKSAFYKYIKESGKAVHFRQLNEAQTISWIRKTANQMGMQINEDACYHLYYTVGNNLDDLCSELQKLFSYYGENTIGINEVKFVTSPIKDYSIFDLMDSISSKDLSNSLKILGKYMEREGKDKGLIILGMIIRQLRLIQKAKAILRIGGDIKRLRKELQLHSFIAKKLIAHSYFWSERDIDKAFLELYEADNLIKSGLSAQLVLEQLIISICS